MVISLGKEWMIIAIDGKPSGTPSDSPHAFAGQKPVFGDTPDTEVTDADLTAAFRPVWLRQGYVYNPEKFLGAH